LDTVSNNDKQDRDNQEYFYNEAVRLAAKLKIASDVPDQIRRDFDALLLSKAVGNLQSAQSGGFAEMRRGITDDYKDKNSLTSGLKDFLARWPDYDATRLFRQYIWMATYQKDANAQKAEFKEFQDTPNTSVSNYIKARLPQMGKLEDLGNIAFTAIDGREVNIEKLRGKVVLFYMWEAGFRSTVSSTENGLLKLYKTYHGKGLEIIGVSTDAAGNKDKVLAFIKAQRIPWPVNFEGKDRTQNPVTKALGMNGPGVVSAMVLVDKKGKVFPLGPSMESDIKNLLSQK